LQIDDEGWLTGATHCPSPNCDVRPAGIDIELLVVHAISLPPGEYGGGHVQAFFQNRLDPQGHPYFAGIAGMRVSAHCLIERDGRLTQFVSFDDRAWHAGASCWNGRECCNDFSIGIELEGCDDDGFEAIQYEQLARLAIALGNRYPALQAGSLESAICGHSDIAPGRKTDPGPGFDWACFRMLLNHSTDTTT
jgi:AmpD protein